MGESKTTPAGYIDGSDLLLGIYKENKFEGLGHSNTCKINYKSTTKDRSEKPPYDPATPVTNKGKFKTVTVTGLDVSISAEGFGYYGEKLGHKALRSIWLAGQAVTLRWGERHELETNYMEGSFIIESLDENGDAGDDMKFSVSFKNSGEVVEVKPAEVPAT